MVYLTYQEESAAKEVISQYDLSLKHQAEALRQVAERSKIAPYGSRQAYTDAHVICASLR